MPQYANEALLALQQRIYGYNRDVAREYGRDTSEDMLTGPLWGTEYNRLMLAPMRHGLHVEFYGDSYGDGFEDVMQTLSDQRVADHITSLAFGGTDEGANGMREWDFSTLFDSPVIFPALRTLFVKPTAPDDHNQSVISASGSYMEEAGSIARWMARTPVISQLTVPNAPDAAFFDVPLRTLTSIVIGMASRTERFIANLADSRNLPALTFLDFSESTELTMARPAERTGEITPFADYEALLSSRAGQSLKALYLRNTALSEDQLQALEAMHPGLQLKVIQATHGGYVSHFRRNVFPWRHLIISDPAE